MNALEELKKRVDENPLGAPDIEYFIVNAFNDARTCRHIQENAAQELAAKDAEIQRLRQIEAERDALRESVTTQEEVNLMLAKELWAATDKRKAIEAAAQELVAELKNNWAIELLVDDCKYEDTTLSGRVMKNLAALVQP